MSDHVMIASDIKMGSNVSKFELILKIEFFPPYLGGWKGKTVLSGISEELF